MLERRDFLERDPPSPRELEERRGCAGEAASVQETFIKLKEVADRGRVPLEEMREALGSSVPARCDGSCGLELNGGCNHGTKGLWLWRLLRPRFLLMWLKGLW